MESGSRFFTAWREHTLAILSDPDRYRVANDATQPYGASDQMALHEMIGFRLGTTDYAIRAGGEQVRLRGMECRAADGYAEAFHARKVLFPV